MTHLGCTGEGGERAALARVYQLWALLHDVEECAAAVPPEAMAALLAGQPAGAAGDPFPLARAWLDAVRAAQARRQDPDDPPIALRPLRLVGGSGAPPRPLAARRGTGALRVRALRVGVAR